MKPKDYQAPRFSGQRFRDAREKANLTRAALAMKARELLPEDGPKISQIECYETDKVQPTVNALLACCAVLDVWVEEVCE